MNKVSLYSFSILKYSKSPSTVLFTNICNILNVKINSETKEMLAYLWLLNVRFQPNLRTIIKAELSEICKDFKIKQKRIKNAPDWLYE
jgi:hypothetical protein